MNNAQVSIKIKKLHPDAVIPQYARAGDAGFDLVAVEDVIVRPGETVKIPTGLAFQLPYGVELQVRDRSGIAGKTKLRVSNAPGTVDAGYRGEVSVLVDNINTKAQWENMVRTINNELVMDTIDKYPSGTYLIKKGDRIAQGVLAYVPTGYFEVVDKLDDSERGTGGFGSSGVR